MSKEKVKLILVIDSSGSMEMTKAETVSAVRDLIEEHRKLEDVKVHLQIFTFATNVNELVPTIKLREYEDTFTDSYRTSGMTALYDAIGTAVTTNQENTKYSKTSLIILTDGHENSSRTYTKAQIAPLLTKVQDDLGWDVTYLGAQMADFADYASSMGLKLDKSVAFDPNAVGTRSFSLNAAASMSTAYFSGDKGVNTTT